MTKKTEIITTRIDTATLKALNKLAKQDGRTRSNYVAWLIEKAVKQ